MGSSSARGGEAYGRVLVVFEHPTVSGGEQSWLAAAPTLRAAGFQFTALAPRGPISDALAAHGVEVRPWSTLVQGERASLADRRRLALQAIQAVGPRLVHCNSLAMSRLVGPVAKQLDVPCLGHVRDIVRLSATAVADVNACTRLVAVSHATRDAHRAQGIDGERIHVCYNGVDLEKFHPAAGDGRFRAELQLGPDEILAVAVGQISLRKGCDVLLAAFRAAAAAVPRLHLAVIGARFSEKQEAIALEQDLENASREPALRNRLHLLPWRGDIAAVLRDADFLVHAARQEPLGRVLLEAAACGRAIAATDVGGTPEILPAECGAAVLVPPAEADDLADAVIQIAQDRDLRVRLGAAARRRAVAAFDVRAAGPALVAHYLGALAASC